MKSMPERPVVQFGKHGKENKEETETRIIGESLLDRYPCVICVCYLALGQKTLAPVCKRGNYQCGPTHNNLSSSSTTLSWPPTDAASTASPYSLLVSVPSLSSTSAILSWPFADAACSALLYGVPSALMFAALLSRSSTVLSRPPCVSTSALLPLFPDAHYS
jgi:hypothetical protein